jgi:16S rRNA (guanine(1405)-N(7))-methyltransferase
MSTNSSEILEIVNSLKLTKKYRNIYDDTLIRIAGNMVGRYKTKKEIIKACKSKLHQIYGAYVTQGNLSYIEKLVTDSHNYDSRESIHTTSLKILELHSSTRERIPYLLDFYTDIFNVTGRPRSITDLACGLNPFAAPWMGLSPEIEYIVCDIDSRLINTHNRYFKFLDMNAKAALNDVLVSVPEKRSEVVFLLKTLPCLEQQEKHSSLRILKNLHASHVVISFPTRSLGGKKKGMQEHYDKLMMTWLTELDISAVTLEYPNEIVYILKFRKID